MKKRFFSVLLSLCMALVLFPVTVLAEEEKVEVTFEFEYGTLPEDQPNPEMVEDGATIFLPDLENCGSYRFLGWQYKNSDDLDIYPAGFEYAPGRDMTFMAVYEEIQIITLNVPFKVTVEQGGSEAPGETTFNLAIVSPDTDEENYEDVTVHGSVDTNGTGTYTGNMTISGPFEQVSDMLTVGAFVQQVNEGAPNWTYDDTVWGLKLQEAAAYAFDSSAYTVLIFPAFYEETGDGGRIYSMVDGASQEDSMTFTNTYTKSPSEPPKTVVPQEPEGETEPPKSPLPDEPAPLTEDNPGTGALDDVPATGDNSSMGLWITLMLVSAAGLFGMALYTRKRNAR